MSSVENETESGLGTEFPACALKGYSISDPEGDGGDLKNKNVCGGVHNIGRRIWDTFHAKVPMK